EAHPLVSRRAIRGMLLGVAIAGSVAAQPLARRATNIAALVGFPGYYHGRNVLVVATVGLEKNQLRASDEGGSVRLVSKGNAPDGPDQSPRGFWAIHPIKP